MKKRKIKNFSKTPFFYIFQIGKKIRKIISNKELVDICTTSIHGQILVQCIIAKSEDQTHTDIKIYWPVGGTANFQTSNDRDKSIIIRVKKKA